MRTFIYMLIVSSLVCVQLPASSACPVAITAHVITVQGHPAQIDGIAFDNEGTLWVLDRLSAKLLAFDSELKLVRSLGRPGTGRDRLQQPVCFSIEGGRVALADEGMFKVFSLKDGKPLDALPSASQEGAITVPASGFLLLPKRLLLIGQTYKDGQPVKPGAVKVSTLASISLKDKRWTFIDSEEVPAEERPALFLFGRGLGAFWPEQKAWVLTQKLPRQVLLVDQDGRVVHRSETVPAKLPNLGPMKSPQDHFGAYLKERFVVALLPAGDKLAIVWHVPSGGSPRYEVEWMNRDLKPLGTTRLEFPVKFSSEDLFYSATVDAKGRALMLFMNRSSDGMSSSSLFSADLGLQ